MDTGKSPRRNGKQQDTKMLRVRVAAFHVSQSVLYGARRGQLTIHSASAFHFGRQLLPGKSRSVAVTTPAISTIALEPFSIATQETIAISLFVGFPVAIRKIVAVGRVPVI